MARPIPGAKFIAALLGVASLFGGAAALADAGRLGLTQFVAVPERAPGPEMLDPQSVVPTLEDDAVGAEAEPAIAEQEPEAGVAKAYVPRPRPTPGADPAKVNAS